MAASEYRRYLTAVGDGPFHLQNTTKAGIISTNIAVPANTPEKFCSPIDSKGGTTAAGEITQSTLRMNTIPRRARGMKRFMKESMDIDIQFDVVISWLGPN